MMLTRRKTLVGLGNTLVGSVAVGTGAFQNAFSQPGADLRVLADARSPPKGFELKPGRDDGAYVTTTDDGRVGEIVLNGLGVPGDGLNQRALTRFENLVLMCKEPPGPPIEELYFEFVVTDDGLDSTDPTPSEIESALFIASAGGDIPGDGTQDFLAATDHGQNNSDKLTPNEELPFGIGIDLRDQSAFQEIPNPDKFTVTLHIEAKEKEKGNGKS